jgi:SsrA-binding protein
MRKKSNILIKNKKAYFEYFIIDEYVSGIQLLGTEIKSIRNGKVSISESYCSFINNELFLINSFINEYEFGNLRNHDAKRNRKLLLTKRELRKLKVSISEKGLTIIPLSMFINDKGLCKVKIGLAKGKKEHDKRDSIKDRDIKRELQYKHE